MSLFREPQRVLAITVVGVTGVIVAIDAVAPTTPLAGLARALVSTTATLTALTLFFSIVGVARTHMLRIVKRSPDWVYSIVLLVGLLGTITAGVLMGPVPLPQGGIGWIAFPENLAEEPIRWVFRSFYEPLATSLLALLVFFSVSAMLRALHQRRRDATVMVVVALLVLLAQAPVVSALSGVGDALGWINDSLVLAGTRALLIGAAIGTFVASLRVLAGFDQPFVDR